MNSLPLNIQQFVSKDYHTNTSVNIKQQQQQATNAVNLPQLMSVSTIDSPLQNRAAALQGYNSYPGLTQHMPSQKQGNEIREFHSSQTFCPDTSSSQLISGRNSPYLSANDLTNNGNMGMYGFRSISLPYLTNEALAANINNKNTNNFLQQNIQGWAAPNVNLNQKQDNLSTHNFGAVAPSNSKPVYFTGAFGNSHAQLLSRDNLMARPAPLTQHSSPDVTDFKFTAKSQIQRKCINCETEKTPVWRRDTNGRFLCNACGLYFKNYLKPRPLTLKKKSSRRRTKKKK